MTGSRPFSVAIFLILVAISLACSLITIDLRPEREGSQETPTAANPTTPSGQVTAPPADGSDPDQPTAVPPTSPSIQSTPTTPEALTKGVKIVAAVANSNRNLAIDSQGNVWEWGTYEVGPANSPCKNIGKDCKISPARVPDLTGVVAVSPGYDHNLALKGDGTVWAWGQNETFQFGLGSQDTEYHTTPVPVPGLDHVVAISASANFSLALKDDGTVWAWGDNSEGQVGDGKNSYTPDYPLREERPFQVVNLVGVKAIATGTAHSAALRQDGTVWTWGINQFGTLGYGTADTEQHPVPAQVPGLTSVAAIGAGFINNVALQSDGSVLAWGSNLGMQLGLGAMDASPHPTPVRIEAFSGAVQVAVGSMQLIALKGDGTVWTCGLMEGGPMSPGAIQIGSLSEVSAISAGEDHGLALRQDGTLWAWGKNTVGQLGDGTMENQQDPVQVIFNP